MILRHKNRELLRYEWTAMGGIRLLSVERLKGFRFRVHPHYNLPRERLALLERFLQKRVSDILQYGLDADDYLNVSKKTVGVKNKIKRPDVGVKCGDLDACALQMIWNMKANPNITARELADVLGVEQRTIERRIRVLREKGIVRRVGVDKTGHWEVLLEF